MRYDLRREIVFEFLSGDADLLHVVEPRLLGQDLAAALLERGIKIKTFTTLPGYNFEDLFRVTIGLPEENRFFVEMFDDAVASGV